MTRPEVPVPPQLGRPDRVVPCVGCRAAPWPPWQQEGDRKSWRAGRCRRRKAGSRGNHGAVVHWLQHTPKAMCAFSCPPGSRAANGSDNTGFQSDGVSKHAAITPVIATSAPARFAFVSESTVPATGSAPGGQSGWLRVETGSGQGTVTRSCSEVVCATELSLDCPHC